jgi:excisionase family DNA binding protein
MDKQKKFLTVPEAAQKLGISERAAWQQLYRKRLPYRRWGAKVVIPARELEEFCEKLPGVTVEEAITKIQESAEVA